MSCALLFMVRVGILWDIEFSARAIKGAAELSFPGLRGLPAHCTVPVPFLPAYFVCTFLFHLCHSSLQNRDRSNSISVKEGFVRFRFFKFSCFSRTNFVSQKWPHLKVLKFTEWGCLMQYHSFHSYRHQALPVFPKGQD